MSPESQGSQQARNIRESVVVFGPVDGSISNFSTNVQNPIDVDIAQLAKDLSKLQDAMHERATTSKERIAVGEIAKAEQCANKEDRDGVLKHLKEAGEWALEIAMNIGIPVAIQAIKKALGL